MNVRTFGRLAPSSCNRSATAVRFGNRCRLLAIIYLPAVLLLLAVAFAAWTTGIPVSRFLLDPAILSGTHPLLGVLSNVGVLLWAATAAICGFTATLLYRCGGEREQIAYLLAIGMLTACLLIDDLFLLHEWFFPVVLGVQQPIVLAAYGVLFAALVLRFAVVILRYDPTLLVLAAAFFSVSLATDLLPAGWFQTWNLLYLLEDGAKWLGIVSWSSHLAVVCGSMLEQDRTESQQPESAPLASHGPIGSLASTGR